MTRFTGFQIRPARPEDADFLAPRLREIDQREAWALARLEPGEALSLSLLRSTRAWTATAGGRAGLMWGVGPLGGLLGFVGSPWLMASDILEQPEAAREFIRQSRPGARELERGFRRLENRVHAENRPAMRWLKWLGFSFAPEPENLNGEFFYAFWKDCQERKGDFICVP